MPSYDQNFRDLSSIEMTKDVMSAGEEGIDQAENMLNNMLPAGYD